jgi:hypothetical protein
MIGFHRCTFEEVWQEGARNPTDDTAIFVPIDRHADIFGTN